MLSEIAADLIAAVVILLDGVVCLALLLLTPLQYFYRRSTTVASTVSSTPRGPATAHHGEPRSSNRLASQDPLVQTFARGNVNAKTIYELLHMSVQEYGNAVAMRSRPFVQTRTEVNPTNNGDGRTGVVASKIYDDTHFDEITYAELGQRAEHFGAGLRILGMEPVPRSSSDITLPEFDALTGPFRMVVFESTCNQWTTALLGALSQSFTVATCYATLGPDAVVAAVQETQAAVLMVNWQQVPAFYERLEEMPTIKAIVASTHELPGQDLAGDAAVQNVFQPPLGAAVRVETTDQVLELGKASKYKPSPPKPSDVAVIMYTSGSTGKPKGVVMRHSNLIAGLAGMVTNIPVQPGGGDRFVSYLPLAHILALQVELGLLGLGATLCYSDPRELSSSLPLFRPTFFAGVPKVYELLRRGLEKKLDKAPQVVRLVHELLLSWKMTMFRPRVETTPVSNIWFGLLTRRLFGGPIQFAVSGGGPISASMQAWCRACFNAPLIQGYALTETCVGGCFQSLDDPRPSIVGPPVPCVEIMLQSEVDLKDSEGMPYLYTDTLSAKGEVVIGRGEICFRGPSVSMGYFRNPEKTKEDFDDEGFFHSGDIGQYTTDGAIQIIDRKKNLVKLKSGEYVAVESMESAFSASEFVSSLCVIANGSLDGPMVLIVVDHAVLQAAFYDQMGDSRSSTTISDWAQSSIARQLVLKSLVTHGRQAGLTKLELRLQDCTLLLLDSETEWKPGHGLTASLKLDRRAIHRIHADAIAAMYERNGVEVAGDDS